MSLPPLKHTARQYWFVAGLCELALKRTAADYYAEAEDSFLNLEPSIATAPIARLFERLEMAHDLDQKESLMKSIIAELWRLHARAAKEEAFLQTSPFRQRKA